MAFKSKVNFNQIVLNNTLPFRAENVSEFDKY